MDGQTKSELAPLFAAVGQTLRQNQAELNQADPYNGNHGDHMITVFDLATRAAQEKSSASMADAMDYAADLLAVEEQNGSARVYGRGLRYLAEQFRQYNVDLDSLLAYVRKTLAEDKEVRNNTLETAANSAAAGVSSGDVLKALVNGLAAWSQSETGQCASAAQDLPPGEQPAGSGLAKDNAKPFKLNMGALFEFGMAYMQAKQRGGSRVDILADAAASISPLSQVPHRYESARMAIAALLRAMQQ